MRVEDRRIAALVVGLIAGLCLLAAAAPLAAAKDVDTSAEFMERMEATGPALEALATSMGALGTYWDDTTASFVVALPAEGSEFLEADAVSLDVPIRVERRKVDLDEVVAAKVSLERLHTDLKDTSYAFYFDPRDGLMHDAKAELGAFACTTVISRV